MEVYLGNIVEIMPGADIDKCKHPYSHALMGAIFDTKMDFTKKIESIEGEPPSPLDVPPGCPFQNRCNHRKERCTKDHPHLVEVGPNHKVSCHMFA